MIVSCFYQKQVVHSRIVEGEDGTFEKAEYTVRESNPDLKVGSLVSYPLNEPCKRYKKG